MTDNKAESTQLVADADKVPIPKRIAYALGGPVDIISVWVLVSIAYPVFNMSLGMRPTAVAVIIMSLRLWDGVSDPIMGWISDNTRTRWGRRRPYILIGAIMAGLTYPLIWWFPDGMSTMKTMLWIIGFGILFYTGFTIWAMPYQSLLMEMTPDYNERTRVAAVRGYMQTLAGLFVGMSWLIILLPIWVYDGPMTDGFWLSYEVVKSTILNTQAPAYPSNMITGIRYLSFGIGAVIMILGVIPAFFVKERYYEHNLTGKQKKVGLVKSFKETLSNKQFMILCTFTIFFLLGTSIWDSYGRYVGTYYVLFGDWMRSSLFGVYGTFIYTGVSLALIPFFKWLSEHIGKTKCLFIATLLVFISAITTWFTYNPDYIYVMLLNTFLIGAGYAGLWLMIPSMQADVIDLDELNTGERREGSYSAVFSWVLKLSFCAGYLLSGPLLEMTGFDAGEFDAYKKSVESVNYLEFKKNIKATPYAENNTEEQLLDNDLALKLNKDAIYTNQIEEINTSIYTNPSQTMAGLSALDTYLNKLESSNIESNTDKKQLEKLTSAVETLNSLVIPGYSDLQILSKKIKDLDKDLDASVISDLNKYVEKMQESLFKDNTNVQENILAIEKILKSAKLSSTASLTPEDIAKNKTVLALKDTKEVLENIHKSIFDKKKKCFLNVTDIKPVTSPNAISTMLRNMRIGYLALPVIALLIALFVLKFYNITKERANEIRAQLEARRGKV